MSNGVTAMWDDADAYEALAAYFKVPVRFNKDGGMWPYDFDSKHYEELKVRFRKEEK